jgi:hypothetical protein
MPNVEATWFVDPPYQHVAKSYRNDEIDCNTVDFPALAAWVRSRSGQVIVCEQAGADWLPFEPFRTLKAGCAGTRKRGRVDAGVVYTR